MFSLAYVILPFSDVAPAEAIRASLAPFRRGGKGDVPDEWLAFHDETDDVRALYRTEFTFTREEGRGTRIEGEPHWYLAILGTDPPHQGKGVGGALLAPVLTRCDTEGTGAYLESSKPDNVPYYERFGFRVSGQIDMPDGPTMWPMWRDPQ